MIRNCYQINKQFELFVSRANIIFNNKYDYSKFKFKNVKTKSIIICKEHGEFITNFDKHIHRKKGCGKCTGSMLYLSFKEKIDLCNEIHNNFYDYSKFSSNIMNKQSIIICPIHGEFLQNFAHHIRRKQGCAKCAQVYKLTQENFLSEAKKVYGDTYDYSKFIYQGANITSIVICRKHGEFSVNKSNHINSKNGCPECGNERVGILNTKSLPHYIKKFKEKHKDKYDYSLIDNFKNGSTKIKILCKKHGVFIQKVVKHCSGDGCPKCGSLISQKEAEWLDYIGLPNDFNHRQYRIKIPNKKTILVDGYDPATNTVYEFYGDFWHGNINNKKYSKNKFNKVVKKSFGELYELTFKRENEIKILGYNFKYIWESDWDKIKNDINTHK